MNLDLPLCPACSLFARRHPELLGNDLIRRPALKVFNSNRVYLINYCIHAAPIFGPHESAETAASAWQAVVEELTRDLSDEKRADILEYETRLD
jgi:hypothetical protein